MIYDDISLAPGQIRIRKKGSAGGHNGMKKSLPIWGDRCSRGSRWGVGEKPRNFDLADYVLSRFSPQDQEAMEEGYEKAVRAAEMILAGEVGRGDE